MKMQVNSINLLGLSIEDFQKIIEEAVALEIKKLGDLDLNPRKEEKEFLTRNEAMDFLDVSGTTLWSYGKRQLLTPKRVGSRVYYSKSELLNLFNNVA